MQPEARLVRHRVDEVRERLDALAAEIVALGVPGPVPAPGWVAIDVLEDLNRVKSRGVHEDAAAEIGRLAAAAQARDDPAVVRLGAFKFCIERQNAAGGLDVG